MKIHEKMVGCIDYKFMFEKNFEGLKQWDRKTNPGFLWTWVEKKKICCLV